MKMNNQGMGLLIKALYIFLFMAVCAPATAIAQTGGDAEGAASDGAAAESTTDLRIGVLAVPRRSADSDKALLMQTLFRSEAQRLKGGGLVLPVDGGSSQDLDQVRKWVDEGTAMMRGNRFTDASGLFEESANVLGAYAGIPDRRLFARAYKGRAIVAVMAGEKEVATDFAQRSMMFWPNQLASAWGYNMDTTRLYRAVTVGWETTPDGGIQVVSSPGQAEVFIDGVSRGFAPVTVEQLRTGKHHVLVVKDGFVAESSWVEVKSEELVEHKVDLKPTETSGTLSNAMKKIPRFLSKTQRAGTQLKRISDSHGGLDTLLVLVVSVSGNAFKLEGMVYKADGTITAVKESVRQDAFLLGNVKGIVRTVFGLEFKEITDDTPLEPPSVQSVDTATTGEDGEAVFIAGGGEVFQEQKKARSKSIYSEWWFWAGSAALVGGIITTVVILSGDDSDARGPTGDIQLNFNTPSEASF